MTVKSFITLAPDLNLTLLGVIRLIVVVLIVILVIVLVPFCAPLLWLNWYTSKTNFSVEFLSFQWFLVFKIHANRRSLHYKTCYIGNYCTKVS